MMVVMICSGKNVLNQKSELQRALEKHKEHQVKKELEQQKQDSKSALERVIEERAKRLETVSNSLHDFPTVFQAEVFTIMASIRESIARGYNGRTMTIFTDSQAALKALESVTVKLKLVLECL